MKGITQIEMKNVHTGEVEKHEDTNQFTTAINQIFEQNFGGMMFGVDHNLGRSSNRPLFPIIHKCLGGVLLFQEANNVDSSSYLAPSINHCVGYASNNINTTQDLKRGSYNEEESGPITNGYRHVWDFGTTQGNGTIASISLTHAIGGIGYLGTEFETEHLFESLNRVECPADITDFQKYSHLVQADFNKNQITTITPESNKLVVRTYWEPLSKLGILDRLGGEKHQSSTERSIFPKKFLSFEKDYYYLFIDGKNGYWYGITYKTVSRIKKYYCIKIDKTDLSFTERELLIQDTTVNMSGQLYKEIGQQSIDTYSYVVIRKDYFYIVSGNGEKITKIHTENDADISIININKKIANASRGLKVLGDWIIFYGGIIDSNDQVYYGKIFSESFPLSKMLVNEPLVITYNNANNRNAPGIERTLYLITPYLATINNLAQPVVKTADKTMKITYTITETEE